MRAAQRLEQEKERRESATGGEQALFPHEPSHGDAVHEETAPRTVAREGGVSGSVAKDQVQHREKAGFVERDSEEYWLRLALVQVSRQVSASVASSVARRMFLLVSDASRSAAGLGFRV